MKRKSLLFAMMLCFACFGVAKADQLTVHNGTTTNSYVPFYGYYADEDQQNQMIYPATELSNMNGKEITAMIFDYSSLGSSGSGVGTWTVKLGETRETTLNGLDNSTTLTEVFTGNLDALFNTSAKTLNIEFDNGYTYRGGNLLVEFSHSAGTWKSCSFYGETVNGASYCYDAQRNFLPSTTFTYEIASSCAKPTNLAVNYEGGTTATVTWEGEARSYNIDVNGTVTNGVSSPYTLSNLELATSYAVKVQADCGDEQSAWTNTQSFFTDCAAFDLPYAYGFETDDINCWTLISNNTANEANFGVVEYEEGNNVFLFSSYTSATDYNQYLISPEFNTTSAIDVEFYYMNASQYGSETFNVGYSTTTNAPSAFTWSEQITSTNSSDWTLYEETFPAGTKYVAVNYNSNYQYYFVVDNFSFTVSTGCIKPTGLEATNIGTTSAMLNWTGDNDSYVLQYRTGAHNNMDLWEQVGSDKSATATLTQYTYDLSDYSGTGSIAIRHYNVSDMFRLAIDDVVVTDARGQELVNEDFEAGSIPSSWTNYDLDGDGNVWIAVSFQTQVGNGDYVAVSDSWQSGVGALTPDNWLIIPNVSLGGTLTFYAVGVDANYPQENFGVFVTTASLETIFDDVPAGEWSAEIATREKSYELTGLTANMPYEWRVKGICGTDETAWVTSSFTTIAEGFKTFITTGDWNVADNWFPVGVPTIEDEVSIEAAATVPAGVVATAKRAVLNGGSILVKDGGQLKQGAATLNITMEKEITGYGESDGNYYFIASPFGGRTQLAYNANWSHVLNVTSGDYDLYAFDPTQELEWINYESQDSGNPHELFYEMSLQSGTGYLYANKVDKTLAFTGTAWSSLNSSTTVDYTYNADATDDFNGWKLVGNPYTCNGYINYVDERGNVLDADFYTLNLDNTYTLMTSNQPLPPCTGALMNVSATGKVQYSTEAPATSKRSGMINMNVSRNNKSLSQARVRFGQGHNLSSMSFRNSSKLYMPVEGNDYAVVYTEAQGEMPVSFKAEENGTYTLSINTENVELGYLHLIDNMTGNDVDLLSTPSYSFDARTSDYANRFKLVFATGNASDDTFAFFSNDSFVINNEGNATLQVVDVNGRILSSETINGCANVKVNAAAGVYMLRLVNGDNVKIQKVVVR